MTSGNGGRTYTQGPWSFRMYGHEDSDLELMRKHGLEPVRMLTNDGGVAVMGGGARIGIVDCRADFKRGQGYKTPCEERDANARLIAAAPDLLTFAQAFLEWHEGPGETDSPLATQARAAITKATGAP